MSQTIEYELHIGAYSPETIPFPRLLDYLSAFSTLLGKDHGVVLSRIDPGSTIPVVRVPVEHVPKVEQRLALVGTPDAVNDIIDAEHQLNKLLRQDNAQGQIRRTDGLMVSIRLPGKDLLTPNTYKVTEAGSLEGVIVRIGGRDQTAHIELDDGEKHFSSHIQVNRKLAQELAPLLFGNPVRLTGIGTWEKNSDGAWKLSRFVVSGYERLQSYDILGAVTTLRALYATSDWAGVNDPHQLLTDMRQGD